MFAIEALDPKIGHLSVIHAKNRIKTPLKLIDCRELRDNINLRGKKNYEHFNLEKLLKSKPGSNWLCPYGIESLNIRGSFGDDFFEYVRIRLSGCQLGDSCASEEELSEVKMNLAMHYQYPNILSENKK